MTASVAILRRCADRIHFEWYLGTLRRTVLGEAGPRQRSSIRIVLIAGMSPLRIALAQCAKSSCDENAV